MNETTSAELLVPGSPELPIQRLTRWLTTLRPDLVPPLTATLVAGGRSNLTYRIADASGRGIALRRPPARIEVTGAHDVGREYRVQRALHDHSEVRVPTPIATCDDSELLGAPFYVMEFVEGTVVRDTASATALTEPVRRHVALSLVDELVELHRTDPARVGLTDLGRPDGYLERQLRRWSGQIRGESAAARLLTEGRDRLARRMPPQRRSALLHGDYRLDNVIFADTGRVRAVLDWELSTQGDPLADLGWLLLYWQPTADLVDVLPGGSELAGFPTSEELANRYAAGSAADLSDLPYYIGFAAWRLAVITVGVAARYGTGARGGADVDVGRLADDAERLALTALRHIGT